MKSGRQATVKPKDKKGDSPREKRRQGDRQRKTECACKTRRTERSPFMLHRPRPDHEGEQRLHVASVFPGDGSIGGRGKGGQRVSGGGRGKGVGENVYLVEGGELL